MKWQAAVVVLGIAALLGLLASLVPAMIASRKNIVESLRYSRADNHGRADQI